MALNSTHCTFNFSKAHKLTLTYWLADILEILRNGLYVMLVSKKKCHVSNLLLSSLRNTGKRLVCCGRTEKKIFCTYGWCVGSAGSRVLESSHRGKVWQRPRWTGRSAAGGSAGLLPAGGPPPWTCPPHPGMSTWEWWGKREERGRIQGSVTVQFEETKKTYSTNKGKGSKTDHTNNTHIE